MTQAVKCNEKCAAVPVLAAWLLLAGCAAVTPVHDGDRPTAGTAPAPDAAVEAPPARAPLSAAELAEIRALLDDAARAIERDHLTFPAAGSAMALYDRVRLLDPDNAEARAGAERIVERYLELALNAVGQRRFTQAEALLDRARLVDPGHPGIAPVATQIALLTDAERHQFPIDGRALRDREAAVVDQLRQAGIASRGAGCRAEIVARSDAEGRWMYQQMTQTRGGERIRAQLGIGTPPRVEVTCFPVTD